MFLSRASDRRINENSNCFSSFICNGNAVVVCGRKMNSYGNKREAKKQNKISYIMRKIYHTDE